ncbi:MAG: hypothetical protein ABWX84_16290 [Nocardioides sp.]
MAGVAVGGHGKVARHLHPLLVRAGHTPVALVRNEAYRPELDPAMTSSPLPGNTPLCLGD